MTAEGRPDVSVVITAHNEGRHVRRTLERLAAQEGGFEVVLVDDRSADDTVAEARAAGLEGLRLLSLAPRPGSALTTRQQALDLGFRAARGRAILTLDADGLAPPGWVRAMSAPILAGEADALAGPVVFGPGGGWIGRWQTCDAAYYLLVCAAMTRAELGGGALFGNFAFRASAYDRLGGFEAIGPALTEDLAFARAIQSAGLRLRHPGREVAVAVAVRPCGSFGALVRRTLRVTRAPVSPLAVVPTVWPLTLLAALGWAVSGAPGGEAALALRYLAGAAVTAAAAWRNAGPGAAAFAPLYGPLVLPLAAAAALARATGERRIDWGGRSYG